MKQLFNKIMDKMVISCHKASFLISNAQDRKLSPQEYINLHIHLAGCHICRQYKKDITTMEKHMETFRQQIHKADLQKHLPEEAKSRMKNQIQNFHQKD